MMDGKNMKINLFALYMKDGSYFRIYVDNECSNATAFFNLIGVSKDDYITCPSPLISVLKNAKALGLSIDIRVSTEHIGKLNGVLAGELGFVSTMPQEFCVVII
jgi:hypothetical protein